MADDEAMEQAESEAAVEHVTVAPVTHGPPPQATIVATTVPPGGVQPSSFMTRWRPAQWAAALLAIAGPLALMFGIGYVFRDQLQAAMKEIGF